MGGGGLLQTGGQGGLLGGVSLRQPILRQGHQLARVSATSCWLSQVEPDWGSKTVRKSSGAAAATASTPRQAGMTIIRMLDRNSRF